MTNKFGHISRNDKEVGTRSYPWDVLHSGIYPTVSTKFVKLSQTKIYWIMRSPARSKKINFQKQQIIFGVIQLPDLHTVKLIKIMLDRLLNHWKPWWQKILTFISVSLVNKYKLAHITKVNTKQECVYWKHILFQRATSLFNVKLQKKKNLSKRVILKELSGVSRRNTE